MDTVLDLSVKKRKNFNLNLMDTVEKEDSSISVNLKNNSKHLNSNQKNNKSIEIPSSLQSSPSTSNIYNSQNNNALNRLDHLVTTVGADLEAMAKKVIDEKQKQQNEKNYYFLNSLNEKDVNDPSKVFTCLQCFERYDSMKQLVQHMEKTMHFNGTLKNSNENSNG